MLTRQEKQRVDNLMGNALLDEGVRKRLLYNKDDTLLATYGLCEETRAIFRNIHATSLAELAQAIVSDQHSGSSD